MRLNRGTVVLLAASLIVIVVVGIINSQRATAPDLLPTATASTAAGPVFPDIFSVDAQGTLNRLEIVDNVATTRFVMTKDAGGVWTIAESAAPQELATDQTQAVGTMSNLASLTATDTFATDNLANFGLDQPRFTMTLGDALGKTYSIKVGNQSPTNPRYYALVNDDTTTVYVVPKDIIDLLASKLTNPPYVPTPTPSPTFTASPNPLSEVEQTGTAVVDQTATALATFEMTPEVTAESTVEAAGEATAEVTSEATAEATAEPTATSTRIGTRTPSPTRTPTVTRTPSPTP
jgi:hypothetical protein